MRVINIVLFGVVLLGAFGLYQAKFLSQEVRRDIVQLKAQLAHEKSQLALLQADWALANQPHQLEALVVRNSETLGLVPITAQQYTKIEDIPLRPADVDTEAMADLLASLEHGDDPIGALLSDDLGAQTIEMIGIE